MNSIVKVENLYKYYGKMCAVNGISFEVERGSIFAILGPNGAGKSTTIDILCTSNKPDKGKIIIDNLLVGRDDQKIKKSIGVVFQDGVLDNCLTVENNFKVRGGLYGLKNQQLLESIKTITQLTGTSNFTNRHYGVLSGGQKRRCDIARSLIHNPKILFLDEPTTGLDPEMRNDIWKTIKNIQLNTNMTVIFTTHYMEEAQKADKIIIMNQGQIAASGTPSELRNRFCSNRLVLTTQNKNKLKNLLETNKIIFNIKHNSIEINIPYTLKALPILELCDGYYQSFEVIKGTIEDAYLMILGKEVAND